MGDDERDGEPTSPLGEPLEYRNPADDVPPRSQRVAAVSRGALLGVGLPGFVGFVLFPVLLVHVPRRPINGTVPLEIAAGFGVAAAAAVTGGILAIRRPAARRHFWAAFLLAAGVACLIEGACFASG